MMMTLVAGLLAVALAEPAVPARVIAQLGSQTVTYDAIRCHRDKFAGKPLPQGTDLDTLCHQLEQQALHRLIVEELLGVAARQYNLEPDEAEVLRALPPVDLVTASHRMDAIAHALLDKMQGTPMDTIREKWLVPNGISANDFQAFALAGQFQSADQVRQYLAQDNVKLMRQSLQRQKRREMIVDRLHARVAAEATRSGRDEEAVAADIWADLLRRAGGLHILDSAFSAPSMKGVLIR